MGRDHGRRMHAAALEKASQKFFAFLACSHMFAAARRATRIHIRSRAVQRIERPDDETRPADLVMLSVTDSLHTRTRFKIKNSGYHRPSRRATARALTRVLLRMRRKRERLHSR